MTGITNQMLKGQPTIDRVMPKFIDFIGDHVLVSHNTIGDMKFLRYFSEQTSGQFIENYFLCTHLLTEKLMPEMPDKSLTGLARNLGLDTMGKLHRAEADAFLTWELFKILLAKLETEAIPSIADAIRLQADYESAIRLGWSIPPARLHDLPRGPGVFYLKNRKDEVIFLAGSPDLAQDIKNLTRIAQLPRQMIKVVQQTTDFMVTPHEHIFAAYQAEARGVSEHALKYDPGEWHQKVSQFIYLQRIPEGYVLGFGPLKPDTMIAFGPVRNGQNMADFFADIGKILGVKAGRRSITLTLHQGIVVHSLLLGLKSLMPTRFWSPLLKIFAPLSKKWRDQNTLFHALRSLPLPRELKDLDLMTGVLGVPNEAGWRLYTVTSGVAEPVGQFNEPLDQSRLRAEGLKQVKKMTKSRGTLFKKPLTPWQAHSANRTFWWIGQHHKRGDQAGGQTLFLSLEELENPNDVTP